MEVHFTDDVLAQIRGKVIVLTGAAQGIGAATAAMAYRAGAHVFIGDWDADAGRALVARLEAEPTPGGSVTFCRVDVRQQRDQLALFEAAYAAHGRVDAAVPLAAGGEPRGFFEPDAVTLEQVRKTEEPAALRDRIELNVVSVVVFCRLALAFLRDDAAAATVVPPDQPSPDTTTAVPPLAKSLVLVASSAGLFQNPGVPVYNASKHAVVGLLRALAPYAPARYGVRVSAVCPSATRTRMIDSLVGAWADAGLPLNEPADVARQILACIAHPRCNGAAVYVSGGRGFETEDLHTRCMPVWLGLDNTADFWRSRAFVGLGDGWVETASSWQEK